MRFLLIINLFIATVITSLVLRKEVVSLKEVITSARTDILTDLMFE